MDLPIAPILSALRRNYTGAMLVALQIALALAVVVNAIYVVKQRVDKINAPSGMDVENIFAISSAGFTPRYNYEAAVHEDLIYLRGLDEVVDATASNAIPLSGGGSGNSLLTQPPPAPPVADGANYYEMDDHGLRTLGVRLADGRNFRPDDVLKLENPSDFVPQILVTKKLAEHLFPNENALGRTVYLSTGKSATVIGIIEQMHGSWPGSKTFGELFIKPQLPNTHGGPVVYLVRAKPGRRDAMMRLAEEHLSASNPDRVIKAVRPLDLYKKRSYLADRNMGIFLVTVTVLLLAITSIGIFGLATFNVGTRTRQIGTRRALGARRLDILCYFMVENWLITSIGVVLGCLLALAVGFWLSSWFALPRLDLFYLVGGVLALWVIGLLAAWQPAIRATHVSPATATRTV